MANAKLNPKILEVLSKKSGLKESTIRQNISKLKRSYPKCTLNAVAQIYASSLGFTVMQKLSQEDKNTIPHNEIVNPKIKIQKKQIVKNEKTINFISYTSDGFFIKGHIDEVNKAYTKGCYTSVLILARKIIENLIIDILRNKYPDNSKKNKELYYDIPRNRYLDFSIVLKNLYFKKKEFGITKAKVIQRLYQKSKTFKDQANDKAHSWYHLVKNRKEIDDLEIQYIIELIKEIEE